MMTVESSTLLLSSFPYLPHPLILNPSHDSIYKTSPLTRMAAGANATIHPLEGNSLTVPHRSTAGNKTHTTATGTATRRRAKSFLRNYYGIQQTDATNQDGSKDSSSAPSGPTSKADPYDLGTTLFLEHLCDDQLEDVSFKLTLLVIPSLHSCSIDSHAFEVDKYMHKMFVEKQLPGLVQADNELVADIRQLDGDMKTLVYENYSKFLSATDTINKARHQETQHPGTCRTLFTWTRTSRVLTLLPFLPSYLVLQSR